jgi:SAM-dependent methyltransferase
MKQIHNEIPDHLQKIINEVLDEAKKLRSEGYVSEKWKYQLAIWDSIQDLENKGIICPGQKVVDLGSGPGNASMEWAYKRYHVTLIEIQHELVELAKEYFTKYKSYLNNPDFRIIEGSYYPLKEIEHRKANPRSETILREEEILRKLNYKHSDYPYIFIDGWEDIYKKHNFSLDEFDIFHAYLWNAQIPSVAEIFKKYAKDDAKLLLFAEDAEEIAPLVGLKQHPKSYHLFTKK